MVDITESELQKLVGENASCICETKQTVIGKNGPQPHGPRMQYRLVAQATETGMAVYYLDTFADHNVTKDGKEREDGRKRGLSVDDEEWDVVDLEAVGEVSYACATSVGVGDDNHLVASINEFLQLVRAVEDGGYL
jgi:hypothetical protein